MFKRLFLLMLAVFTAQLSFAQLDGLSGFPKGSTPKEVGKRLAYHFVNSRHDNVRMVFSTMLRMFPIIGEEETAGWLWVCPTCCA